MKTSVFILMIVLLTSCSKELRFVNHQESISKELKLILNTDQAVRRCNTAIELKYHIKTPNSVWDSLVIAGEKDMAIVDVSHLPSVESQLSKLTVELREDFQREYFQSSQLLKCIDSLNKMKIYNIIKKYGYPSFEKRKWENDSLRVGVLSVLTHINHRSVIGEKIKRLMIKEYRAGRVSVGEMRHYLWDVDGRKDASFGQEIDVNKWIENNKK